MRVQITQLGCAADHFSSVADPKAEKRRFPRKRKAVNEIGSVTPHSIGKRRLWQRKPSEIPTSPPTTTGPPRTLRIVKRKAPGTSMTHPASTTMHTVSTPPVEKEVVPEVERRPEEAGGKDEA